MQKRIYTPAEIDILIKVLAKSVKPYKRFFTNVVGIERGGLHISKPLAAMLGLTHSSVRISRYDGMQLRSSPIIEGELPQPTGNLVVDDLIDDGCTMRIFEEKFGLIGNMTAVLFCKPGGFVPDFFAAIKPKEWITFPWEI
jgi:hypoxanthine phosphoribosyltransferase